MTLILEAGWRCASPRSSRGSERARLSLERSTYQCSSQNGDNVAITVAGMREMQEAVCASPALRERCHEDIPNIIHGRMFSAIAKVVGLARQNRPRSSHWTLSTSKPGGRGAQYTMTTIAVMGIEYRRINYPWSKFLNDR